MQHRHHVTHKMPKPGRDGTTSRQYPLKGLVVLLLLCSTLPAWAGDRGQQTPRTYEMATAIRAVHGITPVGEIHRRPLTSSVVEYSVQVRVGPRDHDVIGLHRVVKEHIPFTPIHASKAVLMAHGDIWGFDAAFLASLAVPSILDSQALPIFLAEHNVDVWGIDFRWTLVPAATTDFSFMQQWDMTTDVQDLGTALFIARLTRLFTGSGFGKIRLLGWSRGGQTGYAYLSTETQRSLRHVRGFIPVDTFLKTDVEKLRQAACDRFAARQAMLHAGTYHDATGVLVSQVGTLAVTAPNDPSSVVSGLTHFQAALFLGTSTYALFEPVPVYHFTGGRTEVGIPIILLYTQDAYWVDFLRGAAPYEPVNLLAQAEALTCDETDLPFDDHLAEITVPVLCVGAGGGIGEFGVYTTTLLGSTDVSIHLVTLLPPADRAKDVGHADLFLADDAKMLVWQPILSWLQNH
jgi:pimeloyl-ACP methyl ester carboxylesterase